MCVSPIHIKVKRDGEKSSLLRTEYDVPCGKCWQCRLTKQNSYYVRSYFEWLRCQKYSGYSIFSTNTYNNENLPLITAMRGGIPCFRREDITLYIKRVRKRCVDYLKKRGYTSKHANAFVAGNIKYICTSENGSKKHRPHYHIAWFVHRSFPKWVFRTIVEDAWQKGFVEFGSENYGFITDVRGLRYVTKYIGKDFVEETYFTRQVEWFQDRIKRIEKRIEFFNDKYRNMEVPEDKRFIFDCLIDKLEKFKKVVKELISNRPFTSVSQNFGMFAFDESCKHGISLDCFYDGKLDILGKAMPIPSYFTRKMMYDVKTTKIEDKTRVQFVLNDFGIEVHQRNLYKCIQSFRDRLMLTSIPIGVAEKFGMKDCEILSSLSEWTKGYCDNFILYSYFYSHYLHLADIVSPSHNGYYDMSAHLQYLDMVDANKIPTLDTEDICSYPYLELVGSLVSKSVELYCPEYDRALSVLSYCQYLTYKRSIIEHNYFENVSAEAKFLYRKT